MSPSAEACEVRVEAGQSLVSALATGGVVCLGPGVHAGPLVIEKSVVLRGEAGAVVDAGGHDSVVRVAVDDLVVRLEALTLRGGVGESGGGLAVSAYSTVDVVGCTFEANRARATGGGGGGVYASRGTVSLVDSTFSGNRASVGTDLFVTGVAEVTVRGGHLHGSVGVREGASLKLDHAQVDGEIDARGTTTRAPTVRAEGSRLGAGVRNDPALPASVEILP